MMMNKVLVCLEPPPLAPGDGVQPRLPELLAIEASSCWCMPAGYEVKVFSETSAAEWASTISYDLKVLLWSREGDWGAKAWHHRQRRRRGGARESQSALGPSRRRSTHAVALQPFASLSSSGEHRNT